ncbi:hypothetical protein C0583_02620 [Candidatus Parcubacteria bacterium]|nr:MAG: hypothetical protein C0583_02620 [Candidatus Parcubacteria bacterium]
MSSKISSQKIWIIILFSLILVSIVPFFSSNASIVLLWLVFLWTFLLAFLFPKIGIFLIIFIRPILDIFGSEDILNITGVGLNTASLFALATITYSVWIIIWKKSTKTPPLSLPWLIFLGAAFFSSFISLSLKISISEFLRLLSIFALFFIAYNTINKHNYAQFIKTVILSALIPSGFAVYQFITKTGITLPFEGIYNRIYGTFAHPNLFAYYLVLAIGLSVFILLSNKRKEMNNYFFAIPLVFFLVMLTLTYTRGAWLAIVLMFSIIGVLRFRSLLIAFLVFIIAFYIFVPVVQNRVNDLFNSSPDSSISWRKTLWKDALGYYQEKPITGFGTGLAQTLILSKRGEEMGSPDPHNDYLKIALENGILGLASYLLLIISLLITLLEHFKKNTHSAVVNISLLLLAISASLFVMSLADNILRNTALMWAYWSILGGFFAVSPATKKFRKENI